MKPSILSLLIAAGAFGASTVYLALQLDEERTRADRVLAESQALQARIAELEGLRQELITAQFPADSPAPDAPVQPGMVESASVSGAVVAEGMDFAGSPPIRGALPAPPPEQSEALLKLMRGQMRAQNKRLYADIGDRLGLTREDTNRLIDLLTDQQVGAIDAARTRRNSGMDPQSRAQLQQTQLNEVAALIGQDKIELFKDYQQSLPARQEVAMISRQLEGVDLELDDTQRARLITALTEERQRIPAPTYVEGDSREDHVRALNAWQDDYQQRSEARVRSIMNAGQLDAYDEYQQWSREMRSQFEARRSMRTVEGNVTMAEPVAVAVPAGPP